MDDYVDCKNINLMWLVGEEFDFACHTINTNILRFGNRYVSVFSDCLVKDVTEFYKHDINFTRSLRVNCTYAHFSTIILMHKQQQIAQFECKLTSSVNSNEMVVALKKIDCEKMRFLLDVIF